MPFYFDIQYFQEFLKKLRILDNTLEGEAILKQEYEDDFIRLSGQKYGHITVEGKIYEHSVFSQDIHFSFETDQTVLKHFIIDLEKCLIEKAV